MPSRTPPQLYGACPRSPNHADLPDLLRTKLRERGGEACLLYRQLLWLCDGQRAAWHGLSLDEPKRKEEQRMRCGSSMGAGQVRQPKPGSVPLSWVTRSGALSLRAQGTTFQMHFKQADVLGTKER
ncbi:hypothetical protein AOLI_G00251050 [Acnodon oligacanthus]